MIQSAEVPTKPSQKGAVKKKAEIYNILRDIPSVVTLERLEEEKRLSIETKSRKSQISRLYNERLASFSAQATPPKKVIKDPQVDGPCSLKICCDIGIDQLCCQYNEDFSLFGSGGADGIVRLFDAEDFNFLKSIGGDRDTEGVTSCVTSIKHKSILKSENIDHHFMFSYVNGVVKCFNYNNRQCVFTIKERRQTYGLTFHPRLQKFITYGDDLKINLYDYETQTKERTFKRSGRLNEHDGHTSRIFAARFNPASNAEFLSGGWDNTVLLWDLRKQFACRYLSDVSLCGEGLDVDKMGRQILTCSWRKEDQLQLWDYSTFKLISSMTPDYQNSKLYCGRFLGPDFLVCGGSDPALLRVVHRNSEKTCVLIRGLPYDVYHLTIGNKTSKTSKVKMKIKSMKQTDENEPDMSEVPKVLFAAGGRIYLVDFQP